MEKLVLIDGNSLLNRAFYATPVFTTKDGLPTNAVFGFVKLILKIISDKRPTHFAVAFDLHAPTFRHQMYSDYKAGRKPMPEELAVQMPVLKDLLRTMNIKILELPGYEADDLLGTVAKRFNVQTYIYTGDRDAYQLVDETTTVCFTRRGVSDLLELTADNFYNELQLIPSQIIDLKALMGDKSDHIPGVAGIGEKTAMGLLTQFKDLNGVYEHIDELKGAVHTKLVEHKDSAYFSHQLATICLSAPIELKLNECMLTQPFPVAVKNKFAELEFKSLLALDIFLSEDAEKPQESEASWTCEEIYPTDLNGILEFLDGNDNASVACDWKDNELRICIFNGTSKSLREYVFPICESLLDTGFFLHQIDCLFKKIFGGAKRVICYNAKDCMHRLAALDVEFTSPFDDVAILKYIADGIGHSDGLEYCLSQFGLSENNRAFGLAVLYSHFIQQLNEEEKRLYYDVELPLVSVLYSMETEGVCVDLAALNECSARYSQELKDITARIYDLAGETFNINSTQQLGKILFDKLRIGHGVKKKKDSKSYKTTAEELEKYAPDYEIVRQVLRYRKIQKLNSTYIEGFKPLIRNGKVHTTYNQTLTSTGRLSSANPNIQNIPVRTNEGRELRKLFTASPNCVLIDADYSQIELRLLAHFSGCKELIEAYCKGEDIHAATASQVFGVPITSVTAQQRSAAKAVNFGIIYGISAFGLSNDLKITPKHAKEYIEKYFEKYSSVQTYMNENVAKAREQGYVTTLLGRRRMIHELKSSNFTVRSFGERAAMNMPLQGSSADIIKVAMIDVHRRLRYGGFKAKLVLQVHDELIIDAPQEEADTVTAILREAMENAVHLAVPLTVDVNTGLNWYETK